MLATLQRGVPVFEGKVLDSVYVCLLCLSMDIPGVQHFQLWSHHCLSCHSETRVPPIIRSPKATFDILKGSYLLYQFKQNLMRTRSSRRSAISCVHQNCRLSNTHLFLTQHYLKVICATALFRVGSDLAGLTPHLPVEFYANSRTVMTQAVWKIYDHATYIYKECFRRNIADVGTVFICYLIVVF
jgi:hypothetical protein